MPDSPQFSPLPSDYESWTAKRKQEYIWNEKIIPSRYTELPPLTKIDIVGLFLTSFKVKMERFADQANRGWKKAIHARASVAKTRFIPTENTPFTGLFKGSDYGLIRLSLTRDPSSSDFAPGLAMKMLIDGHPSANFSALVSLTGQGKNYNFFAKAMSNVVPVVHEFGPKLINWMFRRVTNFPTKLYLEEFAQLDQTGNKEAQPFFPYQIFLEPNSILKFAETPHDFREDLATISPGTTLFSVYGVNPEKLAEDAKQIANIVDRDDYRQKAQLIGKIETTSEFIASLYGDDLLFFKHQRFGNK